MCRIEVTFYRITVIARDNTIQRIVNVFTCDLARNEMVDLELNPIFRAPASIKPTVHTYAAMFDIRVKAAANELWIQLFTLTSFVDRDTSLLVRPTPELRGVCGA